MAAALLFWAVLVAAIDIWRRRIPNLLLLVVLVPTLVWLIWQGIGPFGMSLWPSLGGMGLAFAVLLPGYIKGPLGAGDVKYGACIGLLVGQWQMVLWLLVIAGMALGIEALLVVMARRFQGLPIKGIRIPAAPPLSIGFGVICGLRFFAGT